MPPHQCLMKAARWGLALLALLLVRTPVACCWKAQWCVLLVGTWWCWWCWACGCVRQACLSLLLPALLP